MRGFAGDPERDASALGTDPTVAVDIRGPGGELEAGTMVGDYQIEGLLGAGGMGTVYAAIHPVIAKRAAIKVLHAHLSQSRATIDRFVQEARSVNQIGHPNIVDIFGFGTLPDGRCYFIMECLHGESLGARIARGRLLSADALAILESISIALDAAHERGIVHRDLKPDNVFLVEVKGERPAVKLLDFGIAKLVGGNDHRIEQTQTGVMLGTPAYVSPEQARGDAVDPRTDVYALGVMTFELITGQLIFEATSAAEMLAKHLYEPAPRIRSIDSSVPRELDELIHRMLAKDRAQRPTVTAARELFRRYRDLPAFGGLALGTARSLTTARTTARPSLMPSPRRRSWLRPLAIGLGVVVACLAGYLIASRGHDAPAPPPPAAIAAPPPAPAPAPAPVATPVAPITPTPTPPPAPAPIPTPPAPEPQVLPLPAPVAPVPAPDHKPHRKRPKSTTEDRDAPM